MRNYVILNGVRSTTVNGLLIQSLPPISKPLMRTQVEQIDGRDGDITTKLGYSAYNKEMIIGLYGDYDVDEVIQYFSSEGTVTFSNEPDKYYKYKILEQIDFEKLLRFKTAKVVFHVQPFKYSAVDHTFTFSNQFTRVEDYTQTKNGVTLTSNNGLIEVVGTASANTEFFVPIENVSIEAGNYTLSAYASGTNASQIAIRVINEAPSNARSFGGNYVYLQEDDTVTIEAEVLETQSFNYLWVYVGENNTINARFDVELVNDDVNSFTVINRGNTVSKPTMTIYGSGIVELFLNGIQIFAIYIGDMGSITIDAEEMNAYHGMYYMNRYVAGNYDNLALKIGTNTISWTGRVTGIEVTNFARWI